MMYTNKKTNNRRLNFVALICAVVLGGILFCKAGFFLLSVCAFIYDNDEIKAIEYVADEQGYWSDYLTEKAEIREAIREERTEEDDIYRWCRMSMFSETGIIVRNTVIVFVIIVAIASGAAVSFILGAIGIVSCRWCKKVYHRIKKVIEKYKGRLKESIQRVLKTMKQKMMKEKTNEPEEKEKIKETGRTNGRYRLVSERVSHEFNNEALDSK